MQLLRHGGKPDQIIYDHVQSAADAVRGNVGKIQRFRKHALSGECTVAMNQQRQKLFTAGFSSTLLLGARAAHRNRIDGFKMAWVRDQVNVDLCPAASYVFARRSHVVLDVTTTKNAARIDILEPRKNFFGSAFRNLRDNVQPPAMAHAHYQFHCSVLASSIEDFIH